MSCPRVFKTSRYQIFKDNNPERVQGTCEWVLGHEKYRQWYNSSGNDLLWISADPGCGKSVLAKSLIDNELCSTDNHNVCYFFFLDNEEQESFAAAICGLLHQLFSLQTFLVRHAMEAYAKNGDSITTEVDELWRILKFLVTSRPYQDIESVFRNIPPHLPSIRLAGEESNSDIGKEISLVIKEELHLVMDEVNSTWGGKRTLKALAKKVDSLPKRVEVACERILSRHSRGQQREARLLLHIVVGARRPLTLSEMDVAFQLATDSPHATRHDDLDVDRNYPKSRIRELCGLFVFVNDERIYLIHQTAKEFLVKRLGIHRPEKETWAHSFDGQISNQIMTQVCVQYLSFNDIRDDLFLQQTGNCGSSSNSYPFLHYSAIHWCTHFRNTYIDDESLIHLVLPLYDASNPRFTTWINFLLEEIPGRQKDHWLAFDSLHFASFNGHNRVVRHMLETFKFSVDVSDREGRTCLIWASMKGHEETIDLLCKLGANVNWEGGKYGNALQSAAAHGHSKIARLLFTWGARIAVTSGYHGTPLTAATYRGDEELTSFLICHGADAKAMGGRYGTALIAAACGSHRSIVQYLTDHGANINAEGGHYKSALIAACYGGHEETIRFLLEGGADVNTQGGWYGNALQAACCGGHLTVVELLIDKGAEINALGGRHHHALQAASFSNQIRIAEVLIRHGADIDTQGGEYGSAFQAAFYRGHDKMLELLADNGADIDIQGWHGSALQIASVRGHSNIVDFLLQKGAMIDNSNARHKGNLYAPALISASICGNYDIVKSLLLNGADTSVRSDTYTSCLQAAAHHGHEKIVRLLLDHGADVHGQGGPYGTALIAAVSNDHRDIAQVLIEKGADINGKGGSFSNAYEAA
ncbi:Ankyrin repeat domain-containing protein 50-like protein 3 [Colletotrichum sojae]|uniref:Ankyrin repeat domain-containing protein 50-like protein 3 n=1 Tax=Colletotrichum sojae TaxID=2175907 RepID=A0A8H6MRJ9_9PEZI|nr:Ankyrin repeat domain-containing protein 50-like protein 3 [Colletotrichum sojae]